MILFTSETMLSHLRGREHIAWLEAQLGSKQTNPILENYDRRWLRSEMISVEIYHGLNWFLQAYPHIARVRPIWEPFIDPDDKSIVIRVRLEIRSTDPADQKEVRRRDEFNTLVELCEQIGPETWENFSKTPLEDNAGYANVSEVVEEMESALALRKLAHRVTRTS